MQRKFCVVAMQGDLDEFRQMIDFASVPGEKIGAMNSATVMVATFISNFSIKELEDIFKAVIGVNFFVMDIEKSGIHLVKDDVFSQLMSVFNDYELKMREMEKKMVPMEIRIIKKTPAEIEEDASEVKESVEKEYQDLVGSMTPAEKQQIIDDILDNMPDISSRDKFLLEYMSQHLK